MTLTTQDFIENKTVLKILHDLKAQRKENEKQFEFSDIKDNVGNYYVDLVQEGGGVLGVALMGYTYVLEEMGIRFIKMAGTSAGAINTLLMAAADKPANPKTVKVLKELINQDMSEFVDGDSDVQDFVKALNTKAGKLKLLFKGAQVIDNLRNHCGLNPGKKFEEWLAKTLKDYEINTNEDLTRTMHDLPPEVLEKIYPDKDAEKDYHIAIIAADLTTETKVNFPAMGNLYFNNIDKVCPAKFVRASMSVPVFFQPMTIDVPQNHDIKKSWIDTAQYYGKHPKQVQFIDGGVLSNFPINIFHVSDRMPKRPTFGIRLGFDRIKCNDSNGDMIQLLFSCFNAARLMSDREFIFKNPDFKNIVASIDTKEHDWLNFSLSDEAKIDLFVQGAKAAKEFIKEFDWENYKDQRRAKALATLAKDNLGLSLPRLLSKAERIRKIDVTETPEKDVLIERLKFLPLNEDFNILWIDDKSRRQQKGKSNELEMIESFAGPVEWVASSINAEYELKDPEVEYNLIISDIKRNNDDEEGLKFYSRLRELKENGELENLPPIIYYITNYNPELGVPPFAFGITNSPLGLTHLVADVYQRSGKDVSPNDISRGSKFITNKMTPKKDSITIINTEKIESRSTEI